MIKPVQVRFKEDVLETLKNRFKTKSNAYVIETLAEAGLKLLDSDVKKFESFVKIVKE
jgi:hypothetical protein